MTLLFLTRFSLLYCSRGIDPASSWWTKKAVWHVTSTSDLSCLSVHRRRPSARTAWSTPTSKPSNSLTVPKSTLSVLSPFVGTVVRHSVQEGTIRMVRMLWRWRLVRCRRLCRRNHWPDLSTWTERWVRAEFSRHSNVAFIRQRSAGNHRRQVCG